MMHFQSKLQTIGSSEPSELSFTLPYGSSRLVTQYVTWQLVKGLKPVVPAKNISRMSYSNKKLRKQKGTGKPPIGFRASPNLRHGAISHGPTARTKVYKMNKKARRLAVATLIVEKFLRRGQCVTIDDSSMPSDRTTKGYIGKLRELNLSVSDRILFLVSSKDDYWSGLRNVAYHDCLAYEGLNCRTLLRYNLLVVSKSLIVNGEGDVCTLKGF